MSLRGTDLPDRRPGALLIAAAVLPAVVAPFVVPYVHSAGDALLLIVLPCVLGVLPMTTAMLSPRHLKLAGWTCAIALVLYTISLLTLEGVFYVPSAILMVVAAGQRSATIR